MSIRLKSLNMQERYFLTVSECMMDRWELAHQTKYSSIRKLDDNKYTEESDYEAWNILFKDFADTIGLDEEFKTYIDNRYSLQAAQLEYILSSKKRGELFFRDRKILNRIKRLRIEIKAFEQTGIGEKGMTVTRVMGKLGKMQGYKIKKNETSVLEYFELIKDFKQWQKAE